MVKTFLIFLCIIWACMISFYLGAHLNRKKILDQVSGILKLTDNEYFYIELYEQDEIKKIPSKDYVIFLVDTISYRSQR